MGLKQLLLFTLLLISVESISQEINIGANMGFASTNIGILTPRYFTYGTSFELRPQETVVSYNVDPFLTFREKKITLTAPVYLKFIIGNKFRVSPIAGGFVRTNSNYGALYGLEMEYVIQKKYSFLVCGAHFVENLLEEHYSKFGEIYTERNITGSHLLRIGIRKKIKN